MSATQSAILTNEARYVINDDAGRRYTFQTDISDFRGRTYYHVWTFRGAKKQYVGTLNTFTLQVETTAKSYLPANDYSLTLLNKLLARVAAEDHLSYQTRGYDINLTNGSKPRVTVAQLQEMVPVAAEQEEGEEDTEPATQPVPTPHQNGHIDSSVSKATHRVNALTHTWGSTDDRNEAEIRQMEAMIETTAQDFFILEYDIPSNLEVKSGSPILTNTDILSPCEVLWRYAVRKTKSCWYLLQKGLESPAIKALFNEWAKHSSIIVDLDPVHPAIRNKVRDRIRQNLSKRIQEIHTSLIERIASAAQRLQEANAELDKQEAEGSVITRQERESTSRACDNAQRGILKQAGEALKNAIECAATFDETESTSALLQGLKSALDAERATFNERMRTVGGKRA